MARGRDEAGGQGRTEDEGDERKKKKTKKRMVVARRNDDAGRVEPLAATQVGRPAGRLRRRPGLQDRAVDIIESDRPRAQYYLSFAIAFRGPDP